MDLSILMAPEIHHPQETPCSSQAPGSTSEIIVLSKPSLCCFPGETFFSSFISLAPAHFSNSIPASPSWPSSTPSHWVRCCPCANLCPGPCNIGRLHYILLPLSFTKQFQLKKLRKAQETFANECGPTMMKIGLLHYSTHYILQGKSQTLGIYFHLLNKAPDTKFFLLASRFYNSWHEITHMGITSTPIVRGRGPNPANFHFHG